MNRLYISLLAGGMFALGTVSCSDDTMDTINRDENHTAPHQPSTSWPTC